MHFCIKCIFAQLNIFLWKMYAKMHLMLPLHFVGAEHFPLENVRVAKMHLMPKCILAYIFQRKMFSCAKMHLMPKCIFATHHIFQRKMFSITFSKGKCSASHFPKENVQQNKMLQMHLMRTFCWCVAKMHFCIKCIFAKQNVTNAFDAKMHFGVHFPKENVQLCKNAFDAKMHFCNATRTFSFGKCSASHFPKENVQLCKNAFDALQKCI